MQVSVVLTAKPVQACPLITRIVRLILRYHIQMRAEGELQWKDLATVSGTAAKKKSLKVQTSS